jgi:hypothetical protein
MEECTKLRYGYRASDLETRQKRLGNSSNPVSHTQHGAKASQLGALLAPFGSSWPWPHNSEVRKEGLQERQRIHPARFVRLISDQTAARRLRKRLGWTAGAHFVRVKKVARHHRETGFTDCGFQYMDE